jgi:membrane-bound lytic murein transglycosylase A
MKILHLLLPLLLLTGCAIKETVPSAKKEEPKKQEEVRKIAPLEKSLKKPSEIVQNTPQKSFYGALENSIGYYEKLSKKNANFNFYDQNYTASEMAESLKLFRAISKLPKADFLQKLDEEFVVYESKNDKNSSLITGYYAPMLKGSFKKTEKYNAPIYPLPKDLITADLKQFSVANSVRDIAGKVEGRALVPYYTREEIEKGALKEKPLLYLDNKVDAFLLEVQGSGIIECDGKKHYVGYAGKNGQPYTSIGKIVYEEKLMEPSRINMQTIKEFLDSNATMRDYVLNKNKSFVFFKLNDKEGIFGNISVALTAKESVAMDSELIPRGALAYIKTEVPKKLNGLSVVPKTEREPFEKFFMVQDTGGAIRGGGRVDIYFGEGDEALFYAGQTASKGEVYLIVAKKEAIKNKNGSEK